jgi:hypothetical protein
MFSFKHRLRWSTGLVFAACLLLATYPAHALIVSEMSLDIRGGWVGSSDGRSNLGVLLEVSVPFDPVRPVPAPGSLLQDEQTAPVDDVPLDPLERDSPNLPDEDARDAVWNGAIAAREAMAEPLAVPAGFVAELTAAALAAQGCDAAFARLESLGTRNRVSALLPEVSLRAGREQNTALRLTPTETDPFRYTQSDASNILLEGRLSWRLGRLLFSSEDLGVERLRLARSRERQHVVERALAVFFQWLRAQSQLASVRNVPRRAVRRAKWDVTQATLHLDALTAGWFSLHARDVLRNTDEGDESKRTTVPPPATPLPGAPAAAGSAPQRQQESKAGAR